MHGNRAGYWLYLHLDAGDARTVLICGGTGNLSLDGHIYRMGYWGSDTALSFMAEISAALGW